MSETKPMIELRKDVLKLYQSYLDKHNDLCDREKAAFCDYFDFISKPYLTCKKDTLIIEKG